MDLSNTDISEFLAIQQLPDCYEEHVIDWFSPLAAEIALHHTGAEKPTIVGINGAQGSGKSTLAELLVFLFQNKYELNAISLSLDDFYLTRAERLQLSDKVHPLLMTRGVPGTHDIDLAHDTLQALKKHTFPVHVPRFNKAIDDRYSETEWPIINEAIDIIVIEGWCLGSEAQSNLELQKPVNDLEKNNDPDSSWRHYVNQQLRDLYPSLFNQIDTWVMLKAPSFDCVYNWRLEQEIKLRKNTQVNTSLAPAALMDSESISEFIKYYQRITENTLKTLPAKVDYLFELDEDRQIIKSSQPNQKSQQLLVFTDLDGSLLDHHNYRHDAADSTLEQLEREHIPVIPISSKSRAEIELIRDSIHNQHPFIVENGAAVYIPKDYFPFQPEDTIEVDSYWVKTFVAPRKHWLGLLDKLQQQYPDQFTTFAAEGIDGIMRLTGLNVHAAARAAQRDYGEPVSWYGRESVKSQFVEALRMAGATVLQGGRFMHVSGDCDKAKALAWLSHHYEQAFLTDKLVTLAIGDSQNDQAMLEQADIALLIRSPVNPFPTLHREDALYVSELTGPQGWAEGVTKILLDLNQSKTQ